MRRKAWNVISFLSHLSMSLTNAMYAMEKPLIVVGTELQPHAGPMRRASASRWRALGWTSIWTVFKKQFRGKIPDYSNEARLKGLQWAQILEWSILSLLHSELLSLALIISAFPIAKTPIHEVWHNVRVGSARNRPHCSNGVPYRSSCSEFGSANVRRYCLPYILALRKVNTVNCCRWRLLCCRLNCACFQCSLNPC